jgi:hypothetical protein
MSEEVAVRAPGLPATIGRSQAAVLSDDEIRRLYRLAEGLAASGVFKDAQQAKEAFAKLVIGRDLGLSPAQSMQGLYFVKGAIQIAYPMLGSFVRQHPDYDYSVEDHTAETCTIVFYRHGEEEGRSAYTLAEAKTAGLVKDGSGWKTAPRNMLFARAMSNGVKWYAPDVLGGLPVYVEGEFVDRPALTAGSDAEPVGLKLGPKVDALIARAADLGHAGLANRAAVEMTLGSRSPAVVNAWVAQATAELDALEPQAGETEGVAAEGEPADAEVVQSHQDVRDEIAAEKASPQDRYDNEPEWASKIDVLLHRQADLELAREDAPAHRTSEIDAELDALDGQLRGEGVPIGWHPASAGQAALGI